MDIKAEVLTRFSPDQYRYGYVYSFHEDIVTEVKYHAVSMQYVYTKEELLDPQLQETFHEEPIVFLGEAQSEKEALDLVFNYWKSPIEPRGVPDDAILHHGFTIEDALEEIAEPFHGYVLYCI